jgi:hypothetical protein
MRIAAELKRAREARVNGNEGLARVCARRAAGEAVKEYLTLKNGTAPTGSAYDLLASLATLGTVSGEIRQAAQNLVMRVDEHYELPISVDLIETATRLFEILAAESGPD